MPQTVLTIASWYIIDGLVRSRMHFRDHAHHLTFTNCFDKILGRRTRETAYQIGVALLCSEQYTVTSWSVQEDLRHGKRTSLGVEFDRQTVEKEKVTENAPFGATAFHMYRTTSN